MTERTAADLAREAIKILQRGLPPGDLDDRGVVTELWGLLDNAETREILEREDQKSPPHNPGGARLWRFLGR